MLYTYRDLSPRRLCQFETSYQTERWLPWLRSDRSRHELDPFQGTYILLTPGSLYSMAPSIGTIVDQNVEAEEH